ncbi:xanthine dehydrogenase/oxidase [Rhodotorula toruloides]|uniref:Xanthine dehydrogenase/oxidase n=1 Tax=Rhodotorula toruloides TaxID=5286 RepID=A0A511KFU6_RHOTO|nr:xanthine dehydrogenase/oxidase [Rhodotorula toruloides]
MPAIPSPTQAFDDDASSKLTFYVNGSRVQLDAAQLDPDLSLLAFLRSQIGLTGTKQGCNEGGCGACTVVIQSVHPRTQELQHLAINACLAPLLILEGKHVITVEGIGSTDNPHPLQERMWKLNGSQCGFCTPGIVMSVYAMLRNAAYKGKLSVEDVELEGALDGNLCRCTGYAPIFQAVKSFCGDYLSPKTTNGYSHASNGTSSPPSLASSSNSSDSSSPPATPKDGDFVVPFNHSAAGLEEGFETKESRCCGKPDACAKNISTDVSLPAPSAIECPSAPPIDPVAGGLGRTATVEPFCQKPDASALVHGPVDSSKPKGCGRLDCCQLGGDAKKVETTAPSAAFPQFQFKPYRPSTELIFPPGLRNQPLKPLKFGSSTQYSKTWYRPVSLAQLVKLKRAIPDAKLVGGASEVAIEVGIKGSAYPACIYVSDIPELAGVSLPDFDSPEPALEFGANLSLSDLERVVRDLIAQAPTAQTGALNAVRDQLRYFAGRQIRNAASTGGNIATASPISDLNPVWAATGAKIVCVAPASRPNDGEFELPMDDFFTGYRQTKLPQDGIIVRVVLPIPPKRFEEDGKVEVVRAYKQAKRKDDDIAIVTACFKARVDLREKKFADIKIAFGGMAAYTILAKNTQDYLAGKPINAETLDAALDILASEFDLPFSVPGGMPSYRRTLTLSFLFKFFVEVAKRADVVLDGVSEDDVEEVTDSIHRSISSSTRDNSDPYAQTVVGHQVPHLSGLKHVTGEAIYVDDIPPYANEGQLALVLSTRAHAKLLSVDPSEALEMDGVLTYVDWHDMPSRKANCWGTAAQDEYFFAEDEVTCHGQIIGAIVAKTKLEAQRAARKVKIEYEDLPIVLTIEEAVRAKSFFQSYDRRMSRGKPTSAALAESECTLSGTLRMGGQEHFYLETMASLAIPKLESGEMEIIASTQDPTGTQRWVAQATGVPRNRIVAKSKRMGGGFGGKESRTAMLSAVCAVAAKKLRRPVRCMLERHEDIKISGQRHPFLVEWKVGFTKEGKLTALDADLYANGGYSLDISGGVADRAIAHADNAYYIPNVDVRAKICKTHTVSNTAYRGFGGPQGMLIAETYIEAIAAHLGLDIDTVREINLYKEGQETQYHQAVLDWHIPRLLQDCKRDSNYESRKKETERFNQEHRFRKRGLALVPTKFGLAFGVKAMNQGSALVSIYVDGSVLVAHGGTEMGQGLYTKCVQIAAEELKVPIDAVFTSETATNTVVNTVPTAASAGSDLNGYAILKACQELNKRLRPYREKFGPDAPMSALAAAAWGDRISLSATGHHATPNLDYVWNVQEKTGDLFHYFTQGVAAAEVELDLLTGDSTVRRVNIKMDVGRSINPAIDYGQIEGAFTQGMGWSTMEESLWLRNGAIFTTGPGAYKIPGFADTPQVFNVSLLRDAEWPNLGSVHSSKGIGEPPFFLGCSVALALRDALKSARSDAGIPPTDVQEFRYPLTSERLRMAVGDKLAKKGEVKQKEGEEGKGFFVCI